MGFRTLVQALRAAEPANEATRPQVEALHRILDMPALMASFRGTYEQAGPYRPVIRARFERFAKSVGTSVLQAEGDALRPLIAHVVECLRLHAHHAHPDCRRWAQVCAELHADPKALALLCVLAEAHHELHDLVRGVVSFTVSECNRLGAPVRPYTGA